MISRVSSLWWSPATLFLAWVTTVNVLWLAIFTFHVLWGTSQVVFPKGLYDLLAPMLTVGGVDLTYPLVVGYNVALTVGPLAPLFVPKVRRWSGGIGDEVKRWILSNSSWAYGFVLVSLVVAGVTIPLADYARLPFIQERVRLATDWFPLPTPIDPSLLVRSQYLLTRMLDARYSFVLGNLAFHGILLVFLVRLFGGVRVLAPVVLAYVGVASHYRFFYFLNGADAELPAAVLGLIGLVRVTEGSLVSGIFWLTASLLFKPSGIFFALSAGLLTLWRLLRQRLRWAEVPWGLVTVSLGVLVPFYVGLVWLVGRNRGATGAFAGPDSPFFIYTCSTFGREFLTLYPAQFALAVVGLFVAPTARGQLLYIALSVFLLRCLVHVAGGYYTLFFVPLAVLLIAGVFVRIWNGAHRLWRWAAVLGAFAILLSANVTWYFRNVDDAYISRANSGWDNLVERLRREVPQGATVFFRKVSPRYDLVRKGRSDLTFLQLPENHGEALERLAKPGPVLYMAPYQDFRGTDGPLAALGYREFAAAFGGHDEWRFVVLLKPH